MRIFVNKTLHNAADALISDFYDLLPPGMNIDESGVVSRLGLDALLGEVVAITKRSGSAIFTFFLLLILVGVLMSLSSLVGDKIGRAAEGGVATVASFVIFMSLYPVLAEATEATVELNGFFTALVPVLLSYLTLGGGVATAGTASFGLQATIWVMGLILELVSGIAVAFLAISAMSSLGENAITRIAKGIKGAFGRAMGILTATLTGTMALQTYITSATDSATMRMARFAAGDMIPVVGGAVSGALSTLGGGLAYVGGIIGGGSVVSILAIMLSPLILLLLYKMCLSVATAFLEFTGRGGGVSCFSGFSSALDAVISVYTMTTVVYILEIIILIMGGEMIFGS